MANPLGPTRDQIRNVDPVLTNLMSARMNADEDFVGDAAFPPLYEEGRVTGNVSLMNTGGKSAGNQEITRGASSPYSRVGFQPSFTAFRCLEYGAFAGIGPDMRAESQVGKDLLELAAEVVSAEVMIQRELRIANTFFVAGGWTNNVALGGAAQWDDAGGTPLANLWTAKRNVKLNGLANANAMLIGYDGFRVAVQAGDITGLIPADVRQSQITMSALQQRLAEAFEFDNVFVGRAVRNTANLGQAETMGFILTDNALVYRHEPATSVNAAAAAQFASTDGGQATVIDRWFDDDTREDRVRSRETRDELVIDALKGSLITDLAN